MSYLFSPSELDYKAKKCQRCFYILKKYKISPGDKPPPVFSNFDVVQKNYFKELNSKEKIKYCKTCNKIFRFPDTEENYIFKCSCF